MANFSGAGGYIPVFAIFGSILSFPATMLLWTGMAVSIVKEDGRINENILKRRLILILLPVYVLSIILWVSIVNDEIATYGGNFTAFMIASVLIATVNIFGIFCCIFFPAKMLSKSGQLTNSKWVIRTLAYAVAMVVIGIVFSFFMFTLGEL